MRLRTILLAVVIGISPPVVAHAKKKPALTPMELQAIQSKEFETTKEMLFASVMSVFQDLGYTVESADMPTGFITAASATSNRANFWDVVGGVSASGNTKATAFVEPMASGRARVRLNFVNSKESSTIYGQSRKNDKPILEAGPYQVAWEKIDEALFVRGALAKPAPALAPAPEAPTTAPAKDPTT